MLPKQVWGEGGSFSGNHHGGNLVISGNNKTYQCIGAYCSETCYINHYHGKVCNSNPLTHGQYDSSGQYGTCSQELPHVAEEIWDCLLANQKAVTAEYLPNSLNIQADWQSRNDKDSSKKKLNSKMFSHIVKIREIP